MTTRTWIGLIGLVGLIETGCHQASQTTTAPVQEPAPEVALDESPDPNIRYITDPHEWDEFPTAVKVIDIRKRMEAGEKFNVTQVIKILGEPMMEQEIVESGYYMLMYMNGNPFKPGGTMCNITVYASLFDQEVLRFVMQKQHMPKEIKVMKPLPPLPPRPEPVRRRDPAIIRQLMSGPPATQPMPLDKNIRDMEILSSESIDWADYPYVARASQIDQLNREGEIFDEKSVIELIGKEPDYRIEAGDEYSLTFIDHTTEPSYGVVMMFAADKTYSYCGYNAGSELERAGKAAMAKSKEKK